MKPNGLAQANEPVLIYRFERGMPFKIYAGWK